MAKRMNESGQGRGKTQQHDFRGGPARPHQGQGRSAPKGPDGERKPIKRSKKDRAITIVFEDNDFLVASKPSGLLSVPIPNMRSANLLEALNEELSLHNEKVITVHRIDRYTSGLVVFAKNSIAHKDLVRQFLSHSPVRTYLALVRGVISLDDGELIHFLKKVPQGFRNVAVTRDDPEGAMARLTFKVLERYETTTLVQINLDTGLKNQIRVQFTEFGHPLVGDRHYAEEEASEERIDRQALHSWKLELQHPRHGKTMIFEADIPTDMRRIIDFYKKNP